MEGNTQITITDAQGKVVRVINAELTGATEVLTYSVSDFAQGIYFLNVRNSEKVIISVTGTGFLYNQVRIIAGTLMWVGLGIRKPEDVKDMLEALDREAAGPTAPAHGLLLKVFSFADEL